MFDRFHIVEVYYWYLSRNHGGQRSKEYKRLSKLLGYYKPSPVTTWKTLDPHVKQDVLDKEHVYHREDS